MCKKCKSVIAEPKELIKIIRGKHQVIPISTKLNLWILALPISSIASVFIVGFYFYRESFDASAFSTAVSSLLSAILVILLVWERLRDSLFKKLEYLHKNFLFKLYNGTPHLFWTLDGTKKLRSDLGKYAKFLNLQLCPSTLLKEIDRFLYLHGEFYKRYQGIEELAKKQIEKPINLTRDLLQYHIGLTDYHSSSYTDEAEEIYKGIAQTITKENPKLVSEAKGFIEKTRESEKQIHSQLEDFLKSNNLRLELEPSVPWL
jgi:hypothetical protein